MSELLIPEKLYFKIGEAARLLKLEPYVLRYWQTEFKEIAPVKSRSNQRLYRRKDIETLLLIKKFLYEEGFTIEGARKKVREVLSPAKKEPDGRVEPLLRKIKAGLEEIQHLLKVKH